VTTAARPTLKNTIRSTERITQLHRDTLQPVSVLPELAAVGLACRAIHVVNLQQAVAVCQGETKGLSLSERAYLLDNPQTGGVI